MSFNEILVTKLNQGSFPENTYSSVLVVDQNADIVEGYITTFKKRFPDTDTKMYNILKVYLIMCNTLFFDNNIIIEEITKCINSSWKEYNTNGNKLFTQRYNWGKSSDFAMIEFEEIDIIYNKEAGNYDEVNGTLVSYHLYYKETTKVYKGIAEFYVDNGIVSVELEYTKKPTENKFKKDIENKFKEDYNIE